MRLLSFTIIFMAEVTAFTLSAEDFDVLPVEFLPGRPFDVPDEALQTPEQRQKQFDVFSWKMFAAVNWPADEFGNPSNINIKDDSGGAATIWEHWKESYEVIRDGAKLDDWGKDRWVPVNSCTFNTLPRPLHVLDGLNQAGTLLGDPTAPGPLAAQSGGFVRYEIRMNKAQFTYVISNGLNTRLGQTAFFNAGSNIDFPFSAVPNTDGCVQVKAAWKELPDDPNILKRYHWCKPLVLNSKNEAGDIGGCDAGKIYGLVGIHIVTKTKNAPFWIWSTFEHIDNAFIQNTPTHFNNGDPLQQGEAGFLLLPPLPPGVDPKKAPKRVFTDNNGALPAPVLANIHRINPAVLNVQKFNNEAHALLQNSAWKNYALVDTQWTRNNNQPLPTFVPDKIANLSMESYKQNQSCLKCHFPALIGGKKSNQNFQLGRAK